MHEVWNAALSAAARISPGQWTLAAVAALALVTAIVTVLAVRRERRRQPKPHRGAVPEPVSSEDIPPLLTPPELACFNCLHEVAGKEYHILAKVSLSDIAIVKRGVDRGLLERVAREHHHIDFVLCTRDTMAVACAIELQDAAGSGSLGPADLLEKVGIPVFRLPRKTSYSPKELRELLAPFLKEPPPTPDEMVATISMEAYRTCSKCQTRMVLKRAKSGKYKGTLFWVCGRYPECRTIELFTR